MRVPRLKRLSRRVPVKNVAERVAQRVVGDRAGASPTRYFSAARVMTDIKAIVSHTRWMTSPQISAAARYIKDQLAAVKGLVDVEVIDFLADGRTAYGGWIMPKCWDVSSATLSVVPENGRKHLVLADYRENPFTLMMWSPPTPPEGIEAPVAIVTGPLKNGRALKGKFALMALPQLAQPLLQWAAECGALGVISDTVITTKGVKEGRYLDEAVQYWNYSNPQWDGSPRLPAFGLTPAMGRRLRGMLEKKPALRLRAKVAARLYDGTMPLVTARIPGSSNEEFVITAHMDEPGASDNASGTALAMETLRCMAEQVRATGKRPAVGVRFFASVEARGLQAFLNTRPVNRLSYIGGLNLDMLGYDHTAGRTCLDVLSAQPTSASALEAFVKDACEREAQRAPAFEWKVRRTVAIDDCHFAGAPFNVPMLCLEQAPDKTYHCSLDTPEKLSLPHLKRMGALVLDTLTFFTSGDLNRLDDFGTRLFSSYSAQIANGKTDALRVLQEAKTVFEQLNEFFPVDSPIPNAAEVAKMRECKQLVDGYLHPRHAFAQKVRGWMGELNRLAERARQKHREQSRPKLPKALEQTARELVPVKQFRGYLAFEDLTPAERTKLKKTCGIDVGWGAPGWLQWAVDLCTGKRTVLEIYSTISAERKIDLRNLIAAMRFLHARGQVKFRTVVIKADVSAAVRKVGIRSGDIVMAHTALSDFGYLEGGADAVIDCLLEAVGPKGTVCVPTHSLNWVGKPPYDPKTSPSYTGAVPAAFLRRPDAVRSLHPTHSVAAIGPRAKELVAGHDHNVAPQAREGFWGKFVDAGGKVLMLCRLHSNTLLHGGELWGGVPYPPCVVHYLKDGERVEVTVPGMPWHVHAFDLVHDELRARKRLFSTGLGESTIYCMDAREAVETMVRLITRDPYIAVREKCDCNYCKYVRANLKRAKV